MVRDVCQCVYKRLPVFHVLAIVKCSASDFILSLIHSLSSLVHFLILPYHPRYIHFDTAVDTGL